MKATGLIVPETGLSHHIFPVTTAGECHILHGANGLTNWPDHAEISAGSTHGLITAFNDKYFSPLFCQMIRAGEAEDTAADNKIVHRFAGNSAPAVL
jgi:hypothetical protein